ncbi:TRAP transporter substrate-binding protein [Ralstonia solanacearum]|uniref:TRAP transporter substrate-binding protein n=1 Tax=Ralstonia solanacearum TaxID=305 RepID=UPI00230518B3|nr:TRAP transporter substrate-binding protein [Ralstonia solanacearum]MDB0564835.1 TRAP transporter substrate-binding protein [Ralstonia solanacearum]MDB0575524.1 TRAP transporter substrate-binding protein [Ralstonia solanacearum]
MQLGGSRACIKQALAVLACAMAAASVAQAADTVRWRMATEYPATAMPGEGVASFVHEVKLRTGGAVEIVPSYDTAAGIKSADMPAAERDGRLEAADAFGGALAGVDPVFSLSSLPFIATTADDARRLADLARPLYAQAFARQGLHLLYMTPWPATGLWSKQPVPGVEALHALAVRTYDATSQHVMQAAGAKAENLSFMEVMPRLADGSVTAVLSSGDGGAGRKLWTWLPNFTAIGYAMPLSFATVDARAYAALPLETRRAIDKAAEMTELQQWARLRMRLAENTRRMQDNHVAIVETPSPELRGALRAAAAQTVAEWKRQAGPAAAATLERFQHDAAH